MSFLSLYEVDAASSRFVGGGLSEAEWLFGIPLPVLPRPVADENGRKALYVRFDTRLRPMLQQFLRTQLSAMGLVSGPSGPAGGVREQSDYEGLLQRLLTSVRAADRRQGLTNLFWLAHSL